MWIVVEGSPVDGFVFHGIPAFEDVDDATVWAEDNCTAEWWVAPLQDVEPEMSEIATHRCKHCRRGIHLTMEKAIGEPRDKAWATVWMDDRGAWVCYLTGNEHQPGEGEGS